MKGNKIYFHNQVPIEEGDCFVMDNVVVDVYRLAKTSCQDGNESDDVYMDTIVFQNWSNIELNSKDTGCAKIEWILSLFAEMKVKKNLSSPCYTTTLGSVIPLWEKADYIGDKEC